MDGLDISVVQRSCWCREDSRRELQPHGHDWWCQCGWPGRSKHAKGSLVSMWALIVGKCESIVCGEAAAEPAIGLVRGGGGLVPGIVEKGRRERQDMCVVGCRDLRHSYWASAAGCAAVCGLYANIGALRWGCRCRGKRQTDRPPDTTHARTHAPTRTHMRTHTGACACAPAPLTEQTNMLACISICAHPKSRPCTWG